MNANSVEVLDKVSDKEFKNFSTTRISRKNGSILDSRKLNRRRPRVYNSRMGRSIVELKELPFVDEIDLMIKNGFTDAYIVEHIQQEKHALLNYPRDQLIGTIQKYRDELPPSKVAALAMPSQFISKMKQFNQGVDVLGELNDLYHLHRERVNIAVEIERQEQMLLPGTVKEIAQALEILKVIGEMQMNLGLTERHLGTIGIDANIMAVIDQEIDRDSKDALQNPENRRKILELVDNLSSVDESILKEVSEKIKHQY